MASPFMVDFSLLRRNARFRALFLARMMSVFALGILTVAIPVQVLALTGSSLQVGLVVALDGLFLFIGLMIGGVLADRHDRRRQILLGRGLCALGLLGLAASSLLGTPSLLALYLVSSWNGFFAAIGMSALMAAMPGLVGKEDLAAAGALSMLTVRLGAVLGPLAGGLVLTAGNPGWNYLLAAAGTLATMLPLRRLPRMVPAPGPERHPLAALRDGFAFAAGNRVVGPVLVFATLQALLGALRILFPALAQNWGASPLGIGALYAALPLGAMAGALTSGWVRNLAQGERAGQALVGLGALLLASLSTITSLALALPVLVLLGYVGSIVFLLQFVLVQQQTPDALLGRVNALKNALDTLGTTLGALVLGALAGALPPLPALFTFACGILVLCLVLAPTLARVLAPPKGRSHPTSSMPVQDRT